jgi:hypothetical protein
VSGIFLKGYLSAVESARFIPDQRDEVEMSNV